MEEYEEDKYPFIVMEYLPDGTLEKRLIPGQPSQLNEVLAVLEDICEALLSAHENRIIHGDIKPSNIFYYGRKKMWKLGDFSLSIIMRGKESESRGGTPFYMAPEVKEGKITEKSDIYSLGVMMREMLTGRRGVDLSKVREIYKGLNENQLRELERLVERMTDPDPAKRPHIREIYGLLRKFETFH
jgi:serine/threonine protein kinase